MSLTPPSHSGITVSLLTSRGTQPDTGTDITGCAAFERRRCSALVSRDARQLFDRCTPEFIVPGTEYNAAQLYNAKLLVMAENHFTVDLYEPARNHDNAKN